MIKKNSVFIATSLDGFIAGKKGELDWLSTIPEIDHIDTGYEDFTSRIDALVIGRNTFETVCAFDCDWPYQKPVFVISKSLKEIPEEFAGKAFLVNGTLTEILSKIHQEGYGRLYIDGGKTIQSFLKEDLIDEMIITTIPLLLGEGIPLFNWLPNQMIFECVKSICFLEKIGQNHFIRIR